MAGPIREPIGTDMGNRWQDNRNGALAMIGVGAFLLALTVVDRVSLALPVLGVAFLAAGVLTREAGWLIPGGIMGGISLGIFLIEGPFRLAGEEGEGGLFMLAFALGWFIMVPLSLFTRERLWWALIPAGIMGLIGLAALLGGIWGGALRLAGLIWPVGLIVGGLYLLYRYRQPASR